MFGLLVEGGGASADAGEVERFVDADVEGVAAGAGPAFDFEADPGDGVGAEFVVAGEVEFVDGFEEAEVAELDEVEQFEFPGQAGVFDAEGFAVNEALVMDAEEVECGEVAGEGEGEETAFGFAVEEGVVEGRLVEGEGVEGAG